MGLRVGVVRLAGRGGAWQELCLQHLLDEPGVDLAALVEVPATWAGHLALTAGDLATLARADLDAILRLGETDPPDLLVTMARHGVWSFHHGDARGLWPGPVTRWERHCTGPALRVALVASTGTDPRRLILQEGWLREIWWGRAPGSAVAAAAAWPAKVCGEAHRLREAPLAGRRPAEFVPRPASRALATAARGLARLKTLIRWRALRRDEERQRDYWRIGIASVPISAFLERSDHPVRWLVSPWPAAYLADPFGHVTPDGVAVLAERYDAATGVGELCAVERNGGGASFAPPRAVLPLPVHLSYPYVFEHAGAVYCTPEMSQSGGVHLFRAERFPDEWRLVATLIEGFPALDPTVVQREGRFWLFCTKARALPETALYVWWATELTGPWTPHGRNPIKYDVRSARPAGTPFEHEGHLYRPAQDCSVTYGGAVAINRVLRLTPTEFEEETVALVAPDPQGPYPDGLHTLSALGQETLVDAKRRVPRGPAPSRSAWDRPPPPELPSALAMLRPVPRRDA